MKEFDSLQQDMQEVSEAVKKVKARQGKYGRDPEGNFEKL